MIRHTLVTISVAGPCDEWLSPWMWNVDGPGGLNHGFTATEAEAWVTARRRAIGVLGRLEAPLGGHTLADAIAGPTPPRCLP